jgi:two-component sensor histidine kinase
MFERLPFPVSFQDKDCFIVRTNQAAREFFNLKGRGRRKCYSTFLDIDRPPPQCIYDGSRRTNTLITQRITNRKWQYMSVCAPRLSGEDVIGSMHMAIPFKEHALTPEALDVCASVPMSGRECEVVDWLKEGKSNWEMARLMGITEDTVKYHLKRMMQRLNVVNRVQLVARVMAREKQQVQSRMEVELREVHHRTRNNLSALSGMITLMEQRGADKTVRETLKGLHGRIKSISCLHGLLQELPVGEKVSMQRYLNQIAESVAGCFEDKPGRVHFEILADKIEMDSRRAVACGLIVNELLTNCMKHAFMKKTTGKVAVELGRVGSKDMRLLVSDNGEGFPPGFDHNKSPSLGLKLVEALAAQLDGSMELSGTDGAEVTVRFSRK